MAPQRLRAEHVVAHPFQGFRIKDMLDGLLASACSTLPTVPRVLSRSGLGAAGGVTQFEDALSGWAAGPAEALAAALARVLQQVLRREGASLPCCHEWKWTERLPRAQPLPHQLSCHNGSRCLWFSRNICAESALLTAAAVGCCACRAAGKHPAHAAAGRARH